MCLSNERRSGILRRALRECCGPRHRRNKLRLRTPGLRDHVENEKASRQARPFQFDMKEVLGGRSAASEEKPRKQKKYDRADHRHDPTGGVVLTTPQFRADKSAYKRACNTENG